MIYLVPDRLDTARRHARMGGYTDFKMVTRPEDLWGVKLGPEDRVEFVGERRKNHAAIVRALCMSGYEPGGK